MILNVYGQRRSRLARRRAAGFSLIELLIVIAIILIIAALAVPQYLRSRMLANETSAVGSMRAICSANVLYDRTYSLGYAPSLAALGRAPGGGPATALNADILDQVVSSGIKSGYSFVYAAISSGGANPDRFAVNANPVSPGQTGERYFFVDQTMVIRFDTLGPAGPASPPIGN